MTKQYEQTVRLIYLWGASTSLWGTSPSLWRFPCVWGPHELELAKIQASDPFLPTTTSFSFSFFLIQYSSAGYTYGEAIGRALKA